MPPSKNAHIPYLRSREEYFDYFGGLSTDTLEGLEKKQLPGGLQKSYLLETVGGNRGDVDLAEVIKRSDLRPNPSRATMGYCSCLTSRITESRSPNV